MKRFLNVLFALSAAVTISLVGCAEKAEQPAQTAPPAVEQPEQPEQPAKTEQPSGEHPQ